MDLEQFTVYSNTASLNNFLFIIFSVFSLIGLLSLNKIYFLDNKLSQNFLVIRKVVLLSYVYVLAILINSIYPLNDFISSAFYILGLVLFFKKFIKNQLILEPIWIVFIILFIFLYTFDSGYNNDFDYHLEHILLYKNYSILNFNNHFIDERIKYNSAYLLLNAFTFLSYIPFSVKFLSSFILALFILDIRNYLSAEKISLNFKFLNIFILISVFITLSKFKNIGTDYIAHIFFLSILLFYSFVSNLNKNYFFSRKFIFLIVTSFSLMFVSKISMILTLLIGLHYLVIVFTNKKTKNLLTLAFLYPLIIVLLWAFQNLELSKCLIYPISNLCLIDESLITPIIFEHNMISLFAKSVKINYESESIQNLIELNKFPNWIYNWLNDHFLKILEKFIPIILIFYFSIFKVIKKTNSSNFAIYFDYPKMLKFIFFVILIIWFVQAPALRFGFSYIVFCVYFINIFFLKMFKISYINNIQQDYFFKLINIYVGLFLIFQVIRIFG